MSRLVYIIFLLVVVEGSRNTLDQNTETNASEAKVEGICTNVMNSFHRFIHVLC